jgi:hypothetical protein
MGLPGHTLTSKRSPSFHRGLKIKTQDQTRTRTRDSLSYYFLSVLPFLSNSQEVGIRDSEDEDALKGTSVGVGPNFQPTGKNIGGKRRYYIFII